MSYLLHLETATTNCSVALSQNGNLLHCIENNEADFRHSDHLHLFIEQLLKKAQIEAKQLSGVAVSMGPGSYTGLRIGVSSAKGLCYANDIPLIAVNSLEVLAAAYSAQATDIPIPMFDARRMEVYALVLNAQKEVIQPTQAVIITPDSFQEGTPAVKVAKPELSVVKEPVEEPAVVKSSATDKAKDISDIVSKWGAKD